MNVREALQFLDVIEHSKQQSNMDRFKNKGLMRMERGREQNENSVEHRSIRKGNQPGMTNRVQIIMINANCSSRM